MALVGVFEIDPAAGNGRTEARHHLQLDAEVAAEGNAARVLIHNLSATGLLFQSAIKLEIGQKFQVDLPQSGTTDAQILWRSDDLYGCQFAHRVSDAALSAARLRSPPPARVHGAAWSAEAERGNEASLTALSPRRRLFLITGLATAAWGLVALAVHLL